MKKSTSVLYVFGSQFVTFAIAIVKGLLVPGYLGPKMYGIINMLTLVKTILNYSTLGFDTAYLRLRSSLLGEQAEQQRIESLQVTVFSFLVISSILGSAVCLSIPFLFPQGDPQLQSIMVFAFTVTSIQNVSLILGGFYNVTCVTQKRFALISVLSVLQVVLNLVLLLSTVFVWKIYGVFFAELVAVVTVQVAYFWKTKVHVRFVLDFKKTWDVMRYAFPFLLANVSFYFSRMIDKTIILVYLGFNELGLYSFAINITTHSRMAYKAVVQVLSPYFMEDMGERTDAYHLSKTIVQHTLYVVALAAIVTLNAIVFCDVLGLILQKYDESMIILKILLVNSYVSMVTVYQGLILGAPGIRRQNVANIVMLLAGVINVAISVSLIGKGWGILGVAIGTLVSMVFWQGLILFFAHPYYLKAAEPRFYGKMFLPVVLMLAAVFISRHNVFYRSAATCGALVAGNLVLFLFFRSEIVKIVLILKAKIRDRIIKLKATTADGLNGSSQ